MNEAIRHRDTGVIIVEAGKYADVREAAEKNKADLGGANLRGAYLRGADLWGAFLMDADLRGAEGYVNSHAFFAETVRRNHAIFSDAEWSTIGQIVVLTICWDVIKNRHKETAISVFDKLKTAGFGEWADYFSEYIKS